MALVKGKRTNKSLAEKCKALMDLENGMSNEDFAENTAAKSINKFFSSSVNLYYLINKDDNFLFSLF